MEVRDFIQSPFGIQDGTVACAYIVNSERLRQLGKGQSV